MKSELTKIPGIGANMAEHLIQAMTAPAILIFFQGKEVHRQARFIDFETLEYVIDGYRTIDCMKNYEDIFK